MKKTERRGTSSKLALLGAVLVLAIAGCGSSDGENANGGGSNTNESDGSNADGGADASGDDGGQGTTGRYEFCNRKAEHECAARQPCCETNGFSYDRAGCESFIRDNCEKVMDLVKAGERSFDEQAAVACLEATKVVLDQCTFDTEAELIAVTFWRQDDPCVRSFSGTVEEGGDCESRYDCKAPADGTQEADCKEGKCVSKPRILEEGDDCTGVLDCGGSRFCNIKGKCEKTRALGEACKDAFATDVCGYDVRCDQVTDRCTALLPVGAKCNGDGDCASIRCEAGRCVPLTLASEIVCMGPKSEN